MGKGNKKNKKSGFGFFLSLVVLAVIAILFWSSSLLIIIGMIPTFVAWVLDKSYQKSKTLTIGALNFAGCFPYLVDIWKAAEPMAQSLRSITDPVTIIVIYSAALLGYIINYFTVIAVSSHISEKAKKRILAIEKEKAELEKRWGKKVSGDMPLDHRGFPIGDDHIEEEVNSVS